MTVKARGKQDAANRHWCDPRRSGYGDYVRHRVRRSTIMKLNSFPEFRNDNLMCPGFTLAMVGHTLVLPP